MLKYETCRRALLNPSRGKTPRDDVAWNIQLPEEDLSLPKRKTLEDLDLDELTWYTATSSLVPRRPSTILVEEILSKDFDIKTKKKKSKRKPVKGKASGDSIVRRLQLSTEDFWEFLFSDRWEDSCLLRVLQGELLQNILFALHHLESEYDVISYVTIAYANIPGVVLPNIKRPKTGGFVEKTVAQEVLVELDYYSPLPKPTAPDKGDRDSAQTKQAFPEHSVHFFPPEGRHVEYPSSSHHTLRGIKQPLPFSEWCKPWDRVREPFLVRRERQHSIFPPLQPLPPSEDSDLDDEEDSEHMFDDEEAALIDFLTSGPKDEDGDDVVSEDVYLEPITDLQGMIQAALKHEAGEKTGKKSQSRKSNYERTSGKARPGARTSEKDDKKKSGKKMSSGQPGEEKKKPERNISSEQRSSKGQEKRKTEKTVSGKQQASLCEQTKKWHTEQGTSTSEERKKTEKKVHTAQSISPVKERRVAEKKASITPRMSQLVPHTEQQPSPDPEEEDFESTQKYLELYVARERQLQEDLVAMDIELACGRPNWKYTSRTFTGRGARDSHWTPFGVTKFRPEPFCKHGSGLHPNRVQRTGRTQMQTLPSLHHTLHAPATAALQGLPHQRLTVTSRGGGTQKLPAISGKGAAGVQFPKGSRGPVSSRPGADGKLKQVTESATSPQQAKAGEPEARVEQIKQPYGLAAYGVKHWRQCPSFKEYFRYLMKCRDPKSSPSRKASADSSFPGRRRVVSFSDSTKRDSCEAMNDSRQDKKDGGGRGGGGGDGDGTGTTETETSDPLTEQLSLEEQFEQAGLQVKDNSWHLSVQFAYLAGGVCDSVGIRDALLDRRERILDLVKQGCSNLLRKRGAEKGGVCAECGKKLRKKKASKVSNEEVDLHACLLCCLKMKKADRKKDKDAGKTKESETKAGTSDSESGGETDASGDRARKAKKGAGDRARKAKKGAGDRARRAKKQSPDRAGKTKKQSPDRDRKAKESSNRARGGEAQKSGDRARTTTPKECGDRAGKAEMVSSDHATKTKESGDQARKAKKEKTNKDKVRPSKPDRKTEYREEEALFKSMGFREIFDVKNLKSSYSFERMFAHKSDMMPPEEYDSMLQKYSRPFRGTGKRKGAAAERINPSETGAADVLGSAPAGELSPRPAPSPVLGKLREFKFLKHRDHVRAPPASLTYTPPTVMSADQIRDRLVEAMKVFVVRKERATTTRRFQSKVTVTFTRRRKSDGSGLCVADTDRVVSAVCQTIGVGDCQTSAATKRERFPDVFRERERGCV